MITTFFSILINWLLLQSIFSLALNFYTKPIYGIPPQKAFLIIPIVIMGAALLLALTPPGEMALRFINGYKKGKNKEMQKMQSLFDEVCISADIDPAKYSLYIERTNNPNAFAMGSKTVVVTDSLLDTATDEELKGVLAHELGHIVLGHTLWITLTYAAGQVGRVIILFYVLLTRVCCLLCYIPLVGIFLAPLTWIIALLFKLFEWFVTVPFVLGAMFGSRRDEYAADNFAAQIGYKQGLQEFLQYTAAKFEKRTGFWGKINSTHPRVKERLNKLANSNA